MSSGRCCVVNCKTVMRDKLKLFRIPWVNDRRGRFDPVKAARREKWLKVIRPNIKNLSNKRVCARHFVTGRPVDDPNHPDWVPSKNRQDLQTVKENLFKEVQLKTKEYMQLEENTQEITHFIIDESPDNKNDTMQTYELVRKYTTEFLLVPLSEKTKQNVTKLNETDDNIENVIKEGNVGPRSKHKKILCTFDKDKIRKYEALINKQNNGIRKSEVACNEKFHTVDIFTIFGKSVADQLRSFPVDKALTLQNKIQDLITEEGLKL